MPLGNCGRAYIFFLFLKIHITTFWPPPQGARSCPPKAAFYYLISHKIAFLVVLKWRDTMPAPCSCAKLTLSYECCWQLCSNAAQLSEWFPRYVSSKLVNSLLCLLDLYFSNIEMDFSRLAHITYWHKRLLFLHFLAICHVIFYQEICSSMQIFKKIIPLCVFKMWCRQIYFVLSSYCHQNLSFFIYTFYHVY